jgi:hypothetical protein
LLSLAFWVDAEKLSAEGFLIVQKFSLETPQVYSYDNVDYQMAFSLVVGIKRLQGAYKISHVEDPEFCSGAAPGNSGSLPLYYSGINWGLEPEEADNLPPSLFQDFNESGFLDYRVIGDNRNVQVPGCCGNESVMEFRDIIYLGSCFKYLQAKRFKLIILAS